MPDPFSEQDRKLLSLAAELHRPLARAARIARSNGGGLAFFGGLTILIAAFEPDIAALALGGCLLTLGIAERRAASKLRAADPLAPRLLVRNELILMAAIVTYALLKLTVLRPSNDAANEFLSRAVPDRDMEALLNSTTTAVYATVVAVAILYQGGMARYYWRKSADLERFNADIPEWARGVVVQMSANTP